MTFTYKVKHEKKYGYESENHPHCKHAQVIDRKMSWKHYETLFDYRNDLIAKQSNKDALI